MLLTLTDHLTCPRCGPDTGLILMIEEADDRRVRTGALGCPACRTQYRVTERVADLRVDADDAGAGERDRTGARVPGEAARAGGRVTDGTDEAGSSEQAAIRAAALLGLGDGSGFVLVDGPAGARHAGRMAALAPAYEIVLTLGASVWGPAAGHDVSPLRDSGSLPIATRAMRAVAYLGGVPAEPRLPELLRVCRPTGRLLIDVTGADDAAEAGLDAAADVLARQGAQLRARDELGLLVVAM